MKKKSIKNTRVNSEVLKELSEIIRSQIKDPRVKPMTTVTEVEVTNDLKYCTAYVSVLGNEDEARDTLEGLKKASGFIRKELARRINLRNTPEIRFILDNSLEYGIKMSKLIDEVISTHGMSEEEI